MKTARRVRSIRKKLAVVLESPLESWAKVGNPRERHELSAHYLFSTQVFVTSIAKRSILRSVSFRLVVKHSDLRRKLMMISPLEREGLVSKHQTL